MDLNYKDSFVFFDIRKGMYGLKQAAHISFDSLVNFFNPCGYYPLRSNPRIWYPKDIPTKFALCLDDLVIKYTNPDHDHHIVNDRVQHKM